jgi:anti-sigma factor RsiW
MNHDEAAKLLGAYRDVELDLNTCVKIEEHVAGCSACQMKLAAEKEFTEIIRAETPRFTPSPFLETRIRARLREQQALAPVPASVTTVSAWRQLSRMWGYSSGLIGVLVVLAIGLTWTREIPELDRDAIANHVRSLQVNHLMDVASTDQHTVKPWFAGKLDYSPQVIDLGPSGYPLIGGRLDVLDHRNVAALIYQRRKHFINLFIWPADADALHGALYNKDGYHALGWTKSGMNYLAVSELGEKELRDFVGMIQEQTIDSRPGE